MGREGVRFLSISVEAGSREEVVQAASKICGLSRATLESVWCEPSVSIGCMAMIIL